MPKLLAALAASGKRPEQVRWVVITHAHLDHAAGASALVAACANATLLAHPRAARHMIHPAKLARRERDGRLRFERFRALHGGIEPVPAERVRPLGDGESFALGDAKVTVFHTAGHANHHFVVDDPAIDTRVYRRHVRSRLSGSSTSGPLRDSVERPDELRRRARSTSLSTRRGWRSRPTRSGARRRRPRRRERVRSARGTWARRPVCLPVATSPSWLASPGTALFSLQSANRVVRRPGMSRALPSADGQIIDSDGGCGYGRRPVEGGAVSWERRLREMLMAGGALAVVGCSDNGAGLTADASKEAAATDGSSEATATDATSADAKSEAAVGDATADAAPGDATSEAAPQDATREAAQGDATPDAAPSDASPEAALIDGLVDTGILSFCCNANPDPCCTVRYCGAPMTAMCCEADGGTWRPDAGLDAGNVCSFSEDAALSDAGTAADGHD